MQEFRTGWQRVGDHRPTATCRATCQSRIGVRLRQHGAGQRAGAATDRGEQRPLGIVAQPRAIEIGDEILFEIVLGHHRVPLAALLAELHPMRAKGWNGS